MSGPAPSTTRPDVTDPAQGTLPFAPVLGQSLGAAMPASMALTIPFTLTAVAGRGAWLCVVIAGALVWLVNRALFQFSSRVASAGSLSSYVALGLGPVGGLIAAVSLVIGYGMLASWCIVRSAITATELLDPSRAPGSVGVRELLVALVFTAACGAALALSTRVSLLVTLAAASTALLAVLALVVTSVARAGVPAAMTLTLEGAEPAGIARGVVLAVACLVGFSAATSLSAEAARPHASVPRATSVALAVVVATLFVSALFGPAPVDGVGSMLQWFPPGANHDASVAIVRAVRLLSYVGCVLAVWAALARLTLSLARDGALPARLGATHARRGTPTAAVGAATAMVLGPSAVAFLVAPDERTVVTVLGESSTAALLIAFTLTCLAATPFLQRRGALRRRTAVLHAAGATAMLAVLLAMTVQPWGGEGHTTMATTLACAAGGAVWAASLDRRRPWALTRLGSHDDRDALTADEVTDR
ncbi:APC family permease [Mumia sp. Pv 4-285]|uniref:APC family permease n=1 Tax=Mumia qirimensis TaxID=3234852 RepID=UPI00351D28D4